MRVAEKFFIYPDEFVTESSGSQTVALASYVWSPAAMWGTEVHSHCGFKNPRSMPAAFRSPAIGQCRFPDLKTRMLEHHWLQNNETDKCPSFSDALGYALTAAHPWPVTGHEQGDNIKCTL